MSKLVGQRILFEQRVLIVWRSVSEVVRCMCQACLSSAMGTYIGVVVLGIAIDESIEKEGVERKPPVARGWMELVVLPFTPVLQRRICALVLVEVVLGVLLMVPQAEGNSAQAKQGVEEGQHAPRANEGRHCLRVVPSTSSTPDCTSTGHEPAETNAQ